MLSSPDKPAVKTFLPCVVATVLFMEQLDSTIVNTAVLAMAAGLQVVPLSLKAVVSSYILSLAVCIPISGWMADRFGTRRVFGIAVAVFTLASVLCGLAANVPMLVAARMLQGAGAAMMMPVGRLAIIRTFPKSELVAAMNFVIIPALIGPLLGPTVGGLIVHWMSWREIFFVNVPVGMVALLLIYRLLRQYAYRRIVIFNTLAIGLTICLFSQVVAATPIALIVLLGLLQGFFNSLQFSSMNTMTYSDIEPADQSMASTLRQLSMSFGLARGSLVTGWYLGNPPQTDELAVTGALHHAFLTLGAITVLSSISFWTLRPEDGASVSRGGPPEPDREAAA